MRLLGVLGVLAVLALGACGGKKKAAPPADHGAGPGSTAPVLQPVENKLGSAMNKEEQRATPDPE